MPRGQYDSRQATCDQCGTAFEAAQPSQRFCTDPCRAKSWERGERRRAHRRERHLLLIAFADADRARGCIDCGTKEQAVLEFDHVRGTKVASIGVLLRASSSTPLAKLLLELDKCEVRCANCHRRATEARRLARAA